MTHAQRSSFERDAIGHIGELHRRARRLTRDEREAEDLVQETMLRALTAWQSFRPGTDCRAWLYRILRNSFINGYRRGLRERRWLGRREPIICPRRRRAASDPEGAFVDPMLADEVVAALDALPPTYRSVVVMADLEAMSYREIATALGCPIGTVMSRLHRGRRLLAGRLEPYARERGIVPPAHLAPRAA